MAGVVHANDLGSPTQPIQIPDKAPAQPFRQKLPLASVSIPTSSVPNVRSGHLNLDVFSPVNQNGSFEFDRVLKSGEVQKRSRKTKQWKKFFLVLRPNLLSIYKNTSEDRLHKQINLSDLTAIAHLKDPKGKREYMFRLFSPSRNYHFQARNKDDAHEWVHLIKREARVDEEEEELMALGSPMAEVTTNIKDPGRPSHDQERLNSSSPEPGDVSRPSASFFGDGAKGSAIRNQSLQELEYSGNELGSYSDFSDTAPSRAQGSTSIPPPKLARLPNSSALKGSTPGLNASQPSGLNVDIDDERVIWHGYLLCLKSKGGVRQWKRLWVVMRTKNLAFYKNEEEYSAHLLLPLSSIINAVEIDPVSRSKAYCMQIIAEEKSYRLCAPSEEALARWLGALKSQLVKIKDK